MSIGRVLKRDGRFVDFDHERIANAIFKAAKAAGGQDRETAGKLTLEVIKETNALYGDQGVASVEQIQDIVEKVLINNGHVKTAKAYILYRKKRSDIREIKDALSDAESIIEEYLEGEDWRIRENSNTTFSLQGLNNFVSSSVTAKYWLNKIYSEEIKQAHVNGDFHIHDLGILAVYCCGWDLKDFLTKGFRGVPGKVESSPAKHFRSALGHVINFFYTMQGEAAGAQAFANFDTLLAPFIAYDKLSYDEVKQAMQEFVFNLNVPTRVGFQTPFTNLTFDLEVPSMFKNEAVICGGKHMSETYGMFQAEMDMLNKAFMEIMMAGDAKGRIFSFPIPTYNITKGFDWNREVITYLMSMTGKYGIPYFANFVNSDMDPEDARSMCCRLRLDNRELRKRGGGLFGANPLTGSVGVVTINMPRIGFLADNEEDYFKRLDVLLELARQSLIVKRKSLELLTSKGLYPYSAFYLSDIKARFGEYWKNHFNTIGVIGMNESILNFMGVDIAYEDGHSFAAQVLEFINSRLRRYQEEDNMLYNLEATPAEGTSYRLAKKDSELYPSIIRCGEKKPYYTNSSQLPVNSGFSLFDALDHQDKLQALYTGGTVFHVFIGEAMDNPESVKELTGKIASEYKLPYFTITPTFSVCPDHGYLKGEHQNCPICKDERERAIREQIAFLSKSFEEELQA